MSITMNTRSNCVTVKFPRPLTGAELIGGVKALISECNSDLTFVLNRTPKDDGHFVIGQRSPSSTSDHILVAPTRSFAGIHPDKTYRQVEILATSWFGQVGSPGSADKTRPMEVLVEFAKKLELVLGGPDASSKVHTWPQEVQVCAICNRIVGHKDLSTYICPVDGINPPLRAVKVTLADV